MSTETPSGRARVRRRPALAVAALALAVVAVAAGPARAATPGPAWLLSSLAEPTNFTAADNAACVSSGDCDTFLVTGQNVGSVPVDGSGSGVTLTDTVPAGLTVQAASLYLLNSSQPKSGFGLCTTTPLVSGTSVQCTIPSFYLSVFPVGEGDVIAVSIGVTVDDPSASGPATNTASISGGGPVAGEPAASASAVSTVGEATPGFGVSAFSNYIAGADGQPDTQAGGHPSLLSTTIGLSTQFRMGADSTFQNTSVEDLKDVVVDLPLGFLGTAEATPQCTFEQLESASTPGGCPPDTQVGFLHTLPPAVPFENAHAPIFNMVPERGVVAEFGFEDSASQPHTITANVAPTPQGYVLRTTSAGIPQFGSAR